MDHQEQNARYGYEEEKNFMHDIMSKYLPWWPLFLGLLLVSLLTAWLYLRYATPIFQSNATILVKDDQKSNSSANLLESLNFFTPRKVVENEIEVIRSRKLAKEVATKLKLYAPIVQEGRIRNTPAYISSPVAIEVQKPDSILPVARVPFSFNAGKNEIVVAGKSYPLSQWVNTPYGSLRFLPNIYYRPEEHSGKSMYFSLLTLKETSAQMLTNLEVNSAGKQSSVITISYKDAEPRRGEDILNEWITVYNNAAINDKNRLAANTLAFVDERLKYVVNELDSVEQNMERFKSSHKIVDISTQGQLFLESVGANDQKVGEMNMQLAVLDKVEDYVKSKTKDGGIVPSTLGVSDPVLSQLLESLYTLELEYKKISTTTGENNPMLLAMTEQINKIKPAIQENIRNQKANIQAGRQNVYATNSRYNSVLSGLPQKERQLLGISRQQSIKNSIYTYLLEKREETALAYSSTIPDTRLVDSAETGNAPIKPRRGLIWLAAIAVAFVLSIAFIETRRMVNRNILSRKEIERYTRTPILGDIVYEKSSSSVVIDEGRRSLAAEQFRQLRTSLGYLGINSRKKKIAVTSSISGEGKSFICANLGISLALIGKKVVLVELDIRKPKLSKLFNISHLTGITNYFIGDKEPEEIIKTIPAYNNLFIIPAGPLPPNPSELILNGDIEKLFKYLEDQFDYIIIDTSPVGLVTDGYIISALADTTLYIVRYGFTPRTYLQKLEEQNKIRTLKNPAIIFNAIKSTGFGLYDYSSEYRYGYGYVEKDGKRKKRKKVKATATGDSQS